MCLLLSAQVILSASFPFHVFWCFLPFPFVFIPLEIFIGPSATCCPYATPAHIPGFRGGQGCCQFSCCGGTVLYKLFPCLLVFLSTFTV